MSKINKGYFRVDIPKRIRAEQLWQDTEGESKVSDAAAEAIDGGAVNRVGFAYRREDVYQGCEGGTAAMNQTVIAGIPYTTETGEKLVNETFGPNNIRRRRTGTHELMRMEIRNGRLLADQLSLEREGFVLVEHKTRVADFFDPEQLTSIYYPEVEELIKNTSGAARVTIFDHTLRSGDETERETKLIREPVLSAHNDYTDWSGPNRVREILPEEAESLLASRFAIIQVWRAINQPIQKNPLAVADAKSIAMEDFMVAERRYPHRVGQTYRLKYSANHRWFYFPEMRRDEALVFKVYDSEQDGRARFTPHTSFHDPNSPPSAPARQSIEVRAFAFFAP